MKNSPKSVGKPQGKPQGKSPNKQTPFGGKPGQKSPLQQGKGGPPAKNFQTPKQALKFQSPKQKPGQQSAQKQFSGKKSTPHPMKKKPESEDDDEIDEDEEEDDDFESYESLEDESDEDETPANGSFAKQKQQLGGKGTIQLKPGQKRPAPDSEDDEDESDDDDEELSDEEDDEVPQKKAVQKLQTANKIAPKQGNTANNKAANPQIQKQLAKLAAKQESDDDEDDEDDEDEEDDDDEESDEEESDDGSSPARPVKGKATFPESKGKTQAPAQKKMKANNGSAVPVMATKLDKNLQDEETSRRHERDNRSLFLKNLPKNVTDDEIKALSSEILTVKRNSKHQRWCWIMFANEQQAKKNFGKLKTAKMDGQEIYVDLCGTSSKNPSSHKIEEHRVDALKLYIGNLPRTATDDDVKKQFPTSVQTYRPPGKTFAFVSFEKPEGARQAFQKSKSLTISGNQVHVTYAKIFDSKKESTQKKIVKKQVAKKQPSGKVAIKG